MKVWKCPKCRQKSISININKHNLKANISCGICHSFSELKINTISEPVDIYGDYIDLYSQGLIGIEKGNEKVESESHEVLISSGKILKALSNEWKNLIQLQDYLRVKDDLDIRFLKIKLKSFERENKIKSKDIDNKKYWMVQKF